MTATTQPTSAEQLVSFLGQTAVNAATGAFSAWALTTINPVAGALFCVTSTWGQRIVASLTTSMQCTSQSAIGLITKFAIEVLAGIGTGVLVTTLMGYPLTFTAGLILTGAWICTGIAFSLIAGACITSAAVPLALVHS